LETSDHQRCLSSLETFQFLTIIVGDESKRNAYKKEQAMLRPVKREVSCY
jgi:hypothetical protein